MAGPKRSKGFTLVELLVALTLVAMVLVMLYGGLFTAMRSWDLGEARAVATNELRIVQDFVRRSLRQSRTVFKSDDRGRRVVAFEGDEQRLTFVTPLLEHLGLGGLYVLEFTAVDHEDQWALQLRLYPYRFQEDLIDPEEEGEENLLLLDVTDLKWSYFGADEPLQDPEWRDAWDNPRIRPELVRLELAWRGDPIPPLVVPLYN
ncbi:MAG: type II secretion system protein J [Candidatus Competibacterales bacterium]